MRLKERKKTRAYCAQTYHVSTDFAFIVLSLFCSLLRYYKYYATKLSLTPLLSLMITNNQNLLKCYRIEI